MKRSKQISSKISYFKRTVFPFSTIMPSEINASSILLSIISLSTPTKKFVARVKTIVSTASLAILEDIPYLAHLSFKHNIFSHINNLKLFSSFIFSLTKPPDIIKLI